MQEENEIVKICKIHGNLKRNDVHRSKQNDVKLGFIYKCKYCVYEATSKRACPTHGILKPEERNANGRCKHCHRSQANKKRDNNREWFNEKIRQDKINNPDKWIVYYKRQYANLRHKYGETLNDIKRASRFGLTLEQYYGMIAEQDNKCYICKQSETRKQRNDTIPEVLCVDHNHSTKQVRKLLCHACNASFGLLKENPIIIKAMLDYSIEFNTGDK